MFVDFYTFFNKGETIAVACSGGIDSMCLLHSLLACADELGVTVVALNVEHGIRGEDSVADSNFVADYCAKTGVKVLRYKVDAVAHSKQNKLSLEESARILRYDCFYDAINNGKCDKVCTAHHQGDNAESVLFNLLRGTGAQGVTGINQVVNGKIIRPFLTVSKQDIIDYATQNQLPFVTDATNYDDTYTRNHLRLNVIPEIKKAFPNFEQSLLRFSQIISDDNDYLNKIAQSTLIQNGDGYAIKLPCEKAIFNRACLLAVKNLGAYKDWEKTHADQSYMLTFKQNGASVNLPKGIVAIKEYDKITFYKSQEKYDATTPFSLGEIAFNKQTLTIKKANPTNLKDGFFADLDKIPTSAVIRTQRSGDNFTKFGGGTKKLCDYFTDIKIPKRLRNDLPLLADNNTILAIFGYAISDKIKVDQTTKTIIQLD